MELGPKRELVPGLLDAGSDSTFVLHRTMRSQGVKGVKTTTDLLRAGDSVPTKKATEGISLASSAMRVR